MYISIENNKYEENFSKQISAQIKKNKIKLNHLR